MNVNLDNKVAMVTGGTRGIGLACAELLAASGAKVAVVGRQPDNIAKATEILRKKGDTKGYQLDVAKISAIAPTVERIRQDMGEIDILVCSAGTDIGAPWPAVNHTEADWDKILSVNTKGLFFCNQAVATQSMIPRKTGAIVNIASQTGIVGCPMCIAYSVSKAGVVQITRSEAIEWAAYNIRVNAVAPAWVLTDMSRPFWDGSKPEFEAPELAKTPLHRVAKVDEIAPAVVFLASDSASMVTGAIWSVDGGWTAQ